MPFLGQEPLVGGYHVLDDINASATNTYNLLLGGVAFSPESANHLLVSLNGVIQKPGGAFSVSGSQITFIPSSGTLSNTDSIDFIVALGNVLNVGIPSDNTISTAKIVDNAITQSKIVDNAITQSKIINEAINESKLQVSNTPTNGYFLSAQSGNTGGLTWAEAGGGLTKISTTTVSTNVPLVDITLPTSGYKYLTIHFEGVKNVTDNVSPTIQLSSNGGSSFETLYWARRNIREVVSDEQSSGTTMTLGHASLSNGANTQITGFMDIHIPSERSTAFQMIIRYNVQSTNQNEGENAVGDMVGNNSQTLANLFRFAFSSGDISKGVFTLYGVA